MPIVFILILFIGNINFSQPINQNADIFFAPIKKNSESIGVAVSAKSVLAVDKKSGQVLFAKKQNEILPIASITKLMSVLVLLDKDLDWQKEVKIHKEDKRIGGRIYLGYGEIATVENLLNLALVASDNQAIIALTRSAEFSRQEFIKSMNEKASKIGMAKTEFFDPTGLDSRNVSTVKDLTKLAKEIFNHQEIIEILNKKEYSFKTLKTKKFKRVFSTNKLLKNSDENYSLQFGKTGHLEEAGYCFLTQAVDKKGDEIIIAVLGSNSDYSRFQETKGLIVWVFENWEWK